MVQGVSFFRTLWPRAYGKKPMFFKGDGGRVKEHGERLEGPSLGENYCCQELTWSIREENSRLQLERLLYKAVVVVAIGI